MEFTGINSDYGCITIFSQDELNFVDKRFNELSDETGMLPFRNSKTSAYHDILDCGWEHKRVYANAKGGFAILHAYKSGNAVKAIAYFGNVAEFSEWTPEMRTELGTAVLESFNRAVAVECAMALIHNDFGKIDDMKIGDMYVLAVKNDIAKRSVVRDLSRDIVSDYVRALNAPPSALALLRSAFTKVTSERELALDGELVTEKDIRILGEACSEIAKAIYLLDGSNNIDEK